MNRQERRRQKKLETAAGRVSPQTRARLNAGTLAFEEGRLADAEAAFLKVLAETPREVQALHMLGIIEYQTGRLEEAADHLVAASMVDGADVAVHANLAAVLNLTGRGEEAEAASRHLIDMLPGSAEAHNNLAVALELQGRIDEAEEAGRQAVALGPDYLEGHINLGNLCFRKGALAEAAALYRRAGEIDPANPMPAANLGIVLRRMGDLAGAEAQCRHAIRLRADYAEAYNGLGTVLASRGDMTGALEAFRQAVTLRDGYLEARGNLAAALFKTGDLAAAAAAYRAAIALYEDFAGAWSGLGTVLLAQGDTAGAEAAFRRAVDANAGQGDAWVNLAAAGALTAADEGRLAAMLETAADSDQTAQLWFALGTAREGRGEADQAFAAYKRGNCLRRSLLEAAGRGFDAAGCDALVTEIVSTIDRGRLAGLAGAGDPSDRPVFVVGMPRSGTTLVEQIIAAHPQGAGAGEMDALAGLMPGYPGTLQALDKGRLAALAADYLKRLTAGRGGAARIVDKTPFEIFRLGLVQALLPNARVVYCTRDAADTAFSCFATNFAQDHAWSTDFADIARMQAAAARLMDHWRQVLDLPIHEVRYEDMVADQEGVSRALIGFLGLDWDPACLEFHKSDGAVLTASNWQVRRPLYDRSVGRAKPFERFIG